MAWVRATPIGGHPYTGKRGSLSIACPICDAAIGMQCVVWRKYAGKRDSIIRRMAKPHPERIRRWKQRISAPENVNTAGPLPPG